MKDEAGDDQPDEPMTEDAVTDGEAVADPDTGVEAESAAESEASDTSASLSIDEVLALDADAPPTVRASAELLAIIEALIFASPDPLTFKAICGLLDAESKDDIRAALDDLARVYERPGGLQLVEVAGGYQIVTRPDLHEWVRRLFHERSTQKLSVQALETLAVIAYRQPVTSLEIMEIRGVNTAGVLNTLLERHLVKIVGRKQVVGRPFLYATTKEFLIRFGLNDLNDLPKVEDMAEALGVEATLLVERPMSEDQLPAAEDEDLEAGTAIPDFDDPPSGGSSGSVH